MSINSALNSLGNDIVKSAIANAKPNKKTGKLERSISYVVTENDTQSKVEILEENYGKFLNNKNNFMTKAVNTNLDKGSQRIAQAVADDIITNLNKIL